MNKKGVILSIYVYTLLVFFLLIIGSLLVVLNNTRILADKVKENAATTEDNMQYGFAVNISGPKVMCQNFGIDYTEPGFNAKDENGNDIPVTVTSNVDIWKSGTYNVNYSARYNNKEKTVTRQVVVMNNDYKYTGSSQTFTAPCDGIYKVELWGAQGNYGYYAITSAGKGGYTSGEIVLGKNTNLYVYVGGGASSSTSGGWNGGGQSGTYTNAGAGGSGATDIRLVSGNWNDSIGLKSRIMVAGGGGGAGSASISVGNGGGISGGNSRSTSYEPNGGNGGSQIIGGVVPSNYSAQSGLTAGDFGIGGNGNQATTSGYGAGGGGGYYGGSGGSGGSSAANGGFGGGGGSSFISGYPGCNAIDINGNPTNQPIHYSGMKFSSMVMLDGSESMTGPTGAAETGHSGSGYARITYIGTTDTVNDKDYEMKKFIAIGNNSGIKLRIQKPDNATSVMVRKKTSPWLSTDTTSTGTLVSSTITLTDQDNSWYSDATSTNGTTYYYKAFPLVNGNYKYIPYLNETSSVGGGLVAEYAMEGNPNDTSGVNNNISDTVALSYGAGPVGRTALFNGTTSYALSPAFLESGVYTISSWEYINGTSSSNRYIVATAETGGNYLYVPANQNYYSLGVYFAGAYQYNNIPISLVNKWTNIVYVVDTTANRVKMYCNGSLLYQQVYTSPYGASQLTGTDKGTCIGCNPGNGAIRSELFDGQIDQVRLYNRELLPDEVLSLYNE